jgi:SNF2 family DNA or RNA helicase
MCKLPERNEYIVPCTMTQAQHSIYEAYLKDVQKIMGKRGAFSLSDKSTKNLFYTVISLLRKLCIHPVLFLNSFESKGDAYPNLERTEEYK